MKKLKSLPPRLLVLGIMGLLLLAALVFIIRRSGPLAPVRVTVVTATEASIQPALYGIGTVEARRSYLIGPTSAGRVLHVLVDGGDRVKAGQLLAEMDPVDLQQRVEALDASLARAASMKEAAQAQVADTQARRELARANARRYQELGQQNFVSPGVVEGRQQELLSAEAQVRAGQANLSAAAQDLTRLQAERSALQQQRRNTRLLATQDGVVLSRDAEPGSTVVAGQAVLKLIDPASLWIKARFDQGRSAGLAPGLAAEIVLRSQPHRPLAGKVIRVELQGDSVTEERIAQIGFEQPFAGLSVGELAEVTLRLPATPRSLVLPNAAIRRHQGQAGAWLLVDDQLRFAPLRLGETSLDGQVRVLDGLQPGATVVVYSEKEISAGSRIKVVPALMEPAR
ncbi:MAG: efflux RND transporter periplasmic adaptor subunit [Hylemonella sp.]|nr:efflux RND transporter periplasmic adaptor subunit [Hylemonella sp.]MDP1935619.1 efflux RND transporter periplasmic adaptor subunit [Hylemonella sp.]